MNDGTTNTPRRRTIRWISVGFVSLVTVLLALGWWSRDDPPPDVSDFIFEPLQLPEDQNAYALLTKAATSLPEREWTDGEDASPCPTKPSTNEKPSSI